MTYNLQAAIERLRKGDYVEAVGAIGAHIKNRQDILAVCDALEAETKKNAKLQELLVVHERDYIAATKAAEVAEARMREMEDVLTTAYLTGFHKRDDEVAKLKEKK